MRERDAPGPPSLPTLPCLLAWAFRGLPMLVSRATQVHRSTRARTRVRRPCPVPIEALSDAVTFGRPNGRSDVGRDGREGREGGTEADADGGGARALRQRRIPSLRNRNTQIAVWLAEWPRVIHPLFSALDFLTVAAEEKNSLQFVAVGRRRGGQTDRGSDSRRIFDPEC